MQTVLSPFSHRKTEFNLERSALLILDMQRYSLDADSHAFVPSAESILPRKKVGYDVRCDRPPFLWTI